MEITTEALDMLIKCHACHERVPEWGERAWIARGKDADVIYWDTGNSWCDILHVIPKVNDPENWLKWFFQKVATFSEDDDDWWESVTKYSYSKSSNSVRCSRLSKNEKTVFRSSTQQLSEEDEKSSE